MLCHHLGGVRASSDLSTVGLGEVIASAAVPNLFVKASGFHYSSERSWDYPWADALAVLRRIYDAYGSARLCWGSDFPASAPDCTYRQSLEVLRLHCPFLSSHDLELMLGKTLSGLLATGQVSP